MPPSPSPEPLPEFPGALYDRLHIAACLYDQDDTLRAWNATWLRFFPEHGRGVRPGMPRRDLLRREVAARQAGELPPGYLDELLRQAHDTGTPTLTRHHGRWLRGATERAGSGWLCLWTQVPDPRGPGHRAPDGIVLASPADELQAARDQAHSAGQLARLLAAHGGDALLGLAADGRIVYVTPSLQALLGHPPQDFIGYDLSHLVCVEDRPAFVAGRRERRERGLPAGGSYTVRARHRTGALMWLELRVQGVPAEVDPGGLEAVCEVRDVTERQAAQSALAAAQAELARAATHDPLTGLVHRRYFDELLQREWRRLQRDRGTLALLLIEADAEAHWRERHGALVADAALRAVAGVLRAYTRRAGDIAARHDGAVFAVALPQTDQDAAIALAERIRSMVDQDEHLLPRGLPALHPTVSIGVACATPGETAPDVASLLQAAAAALEAARAQGRNRVAWAPVQDGET